MAIARETPMLCAPVWCSALSGRRRMMVGRAAAVATPHCPSSKREARDTETDVEQEQQRVRDKDQCPCGVRSPCAVIRHALWVGPADNEAYRDHAVREPTHNPPGKQSEPSRAGMLRPGCEQGERGEQQSKRDPCEAERDGPGVQVRTERVADVCAIWSACRHPEPQDEDGARQAQRPTGMCEDASTERHRTVSDSDGDHRAGRETERACESKANQPHACLHTRTSFAT